MGGRGAVLSPPGRLHTTSPDTRYLLERESGATVSVPLSHGQTEGEVGALLSVFWLLCNKYITF